MHTQKGNHLAPRSWRALLETTPSPFFFTTLPPCRPPLKTCSWLLGHCKAGSTHQRHECHGTAEGTIVHDGLQSPRATRKKKTALERTKRRCGFILKKWQTCNKTESVTGLSSNTHQGAQCILVACITHQCSPSVPVQASSEAEARSNHHN